MLLSKKPDTTTTTSPAPSPTPPTDGNSQCTEVDGTTGAGEIYDKSITSPGMSLVYEGIEPTTYLSGLLSTCAVIQACANICDFNDYVSFNIYYELAEEQWVCVINAAVVETLAPTPNSDVGQSYGYELVGFVDKPAVEDRRYWHMNRDPR